MGKLILKFAPLPKIDKCNKILFIGPHPDDIEIGCGGLISKLARSGKEFYFLVCTDGGCGSQDRNAKYEDIAKIRKEEATKAANFLGAKDIFFLDYPDGGRYSVDDLKVDIAKVIIKLKPDLVLCPSPNLETETHMDHINVANASRSAVLISQFPLVAKRQGIDIENINSFASPFTLAYYFSAKVNQIVKIKKCDLNKKIEALKIHESQPDASSKDIITYFKYKAYTLGLKKLCGLGEGYYVLGPLHQHCFSENI